MKQLGIEIINAAFNNVKYPSTIMGNFGFCTYARSNELKQKN